MSGGFWGWPDTRTWWTYLWVALAGAVWFAVLYGGADYVTARRAFRVPIHFEWELRIPLVAWTAWIYMSIYALFVMCPFVLRSPRQIVSLGAALASVTAVAAVCFLLLPAELAFPRQPIGDGLTGRVYAFADWLNLGHNLLPSLHVALTVTCVGAYARRARPAGRLLLWGWAVAVAISTVLTHFHHVLDAVTGFTLGLAASRINRQSTIQSSIVTRQWQSSVVNRQ